MEYHGTRLPTRARRSEPSWPAVIVTTLRLWYQRHPLIGQRAPRRRRLAVLGAAALVVLAAVAAGAAGLASSASHPAAGPAAASSPRAVSPPHPAGTGTAAASAIQASAATRNAAAQWIAGQVAASAVVSCDPAMCAALQANGIPASRLLVLGTAVADPLGADVVVATAAVRNGFGPRLASVYAPAVIASFGSGNERIDIRVIAPDGTAAYDQAVAADHRSRVSAGRQLLSNPQISVSVSARAALTAGDVDSRLLTLLAALAEQQPVRVTSFGDPSPGASPAVPLRSARVAPQASGAAGSRLRSMLSFIDAQRQPYLPLRAGLAGKAALTVEYAAPSPLGLLGEP